MKIELEISEKNEGTAAPYWLIIDPKQMMRPDACMVAMMMITGPFFSREAAVRQLKHRSYNYSKHAVVWCLSGYYSREYYDAILMETRKERKK
jgi:hypothetical protein